MAKPNKPNLRRYHQKVYFPENVGEMAGEFIQQIKEIDLTFHAAEQLMEDKRGIIPLPTRQELFHNGNTLVEFYEQCDPTGKPLGKIQKVLIRVHNLDDQLDYSYVLAREGFIVSAWANDKGDDHRLTNATDYYNPDKGQIL